MLSKEPELSPSRTPECGKSDPNPGLKRGIWEYREGLQKSSQRMKPMTKGKIETKVNSAEGREGFSST